MGSDWVKMQAEMERLQMEIAHYRRRVVALEQSLQDRRAAQDARGCDLTGSEGETGSESIRGSERNSAARNEGDA